MFQSILVQPLYNIFIYLVSVMPGGDVGFAIIALTLIVRALFYPAFAAQIRTTMSMQSVQAELDEINKKYKDNSEERAKRTMAIFKENKINPLSGIIALLIQIPILLALYFAFFREGLPHITTSLLYSFVHAPAAVNTIFLGVVNLLTPHNIVMALLVGLLQYAVIYFSISRTNKHVPLHTLSEEKRATQQMQQTMMLYVMPAIIASVTYSLPAAVGVYFIAGNVVSLGQEWLIRREIALKRGQNSAQ